jgi:hypothetical protein
MKSLLTIIFCLSCVSPPGDMIPWQQEYRVVWSDFKGAVPAGAGNAALTSYHTTLNIGYSSEKGFSYTVRCEFDRNRSWVRVKTAEVLEHERGHFDIGEVYARKLRERLSRFNYRAGSGNALNRVYDSVMKACGKVQQLYDDETDYSRDRSGQQRWNARIPLMLDSLRLWTKSTYNNPPSR